MAQIFYDYHPEELGPVVIPREKVSFDDFEPVCIWPTSSFAELNLSFKEAEKSVV